MSQQTVPQLIRQIFLGSKARQIGSLVILVISLAAAIATLWPVLKDWWRPTELHVYVLHPAADRSGQGVWNDFDRGLDDFLTEHGGRLDGASIRVRKHRLSFERATWPANDEHELLERVEKVLENPRTLAVIAATSSEDSEMILRRFAQEDDPPLLLLTLATRSDLLQKISPRGDSFPMQGVFRMVPKNDDQAAALADAILSSQPPACDSRDEDARSVIILREDANNAKFSQDLSAALQRELGRAQGVRVLVDSAIDTLVSVPRELVDLRAHFLVYIGSQTRAASIYEQMSRLRELSPDPLCPLPRLLLTDAGLLGNGESHYRKAAIEGSVVVLPLASKQGGRVDFGVLGLDSARLLREAANEVVDSRLNRVALRHAVENLRMQGEAHIYRFEAGENVLADFHLWSVAAGEWRHDSDCSSDGHDLEEIRAVGRQAPMARPAHLPGESTVAPLRIGSKTFPEQRILAAMAVALLKDAGIPARLERVSLNGIHGLLLRDRIDAYWEYTGTALVRHHDRRELRGLRGPEALRELRRLDGFRLAWLDPLPIDNTYVLLVRDDSPAFRDVDTISKLADHVRRGSGATICSNFEWFPKPDGLVGLQEAYDFRWPEEDRIVKELELLYEDASDCNVLVGYATDPQVHGGEWRSLTDDRRFFPEYRPALVFREDVYRRLREEHAERLQTVQQRLACVAEHLDAAAMSHLIEAEEAGRAGAEDLAVTFLQTCPHPGGASATVAEGSGRPSAVES